MSLETQFKTGFILKPSNEFDLCLHIRSPSTGKFSECLTKTNVVQDLLRVATHDDHKNAVKHNAAIAIGKLASTQPW